MLMRYLYRLLTLYFRLLYSPVSILSEISVKIDEKKNERKIKDGSKKIIVPFWYSLDIFIIQFFLTMSISVLILLPLFFLFDYNTEILITFSLKFGLGVLIGVLGITLGSLVFFAISRSSDISGSFVRSLTRIWLFGISSGLLLGLFVLNSGETFDQLNSYNFVYFSVLLGFFIQKIYQLMSITNTIDGKGVKNKIEILIQSQNKKSQYASFTLIFLINLLLLIFLFISFDRSFEFSYAFLRDDLLKYFLPMFFSLGWTIGLWFPDLGYRFISLFFYFLKNKNRVVELLVNDEIIGKFRFHRKYLNKVFKNNKEFYFQSLDKYYLNTPYGNKVIFELLKRFDHKKHQNTILEYLNNSENIILIKNINNYHFKEVVLKNENSIRKHVFEIQQVDKMIFTTDDIIKDFFRKEFAFYFYERVKAVYLWFSFNSSQYRSNLKNNKIKIENEFKIKPYLYLSKSIETIYRIFQDQVEVLIRDYENHELSIVFLERNVKINKGKTYLNIQAINRENKKLLINSIECSASKNNSKELFIKKFEFEKQINLESYIQFYVPIEIRKELSTKITIKVSYSTQNGKLKFKEKYEIIEFVKVPAFIKLNNPYSLKAVTDSNMFFGREKEIEEITWAIQAKNYPEIITILAARRMGKTSLLLNLERILNSNYRIFYIDAQFLDYNDLSVIGLMGEILSEIDIDYQKELTVKAFFEVLAEKRTILLFDEFDVILKRMDKNESLKLLHYIRDFKIENKPIFILSIPKSLLNSINIEIQNIFMSGLTISLNPLNKNAAIKLITNPLKEFILFTPQAFLHIYSLCGGFPNLIQTYCFLLTNYNNRVIKSSEITYDILTKFESQKSTNISEQTIVFILSLPEIHRKILWVLKHNDNNIHSDEIKTEISKYYSVKNLNSELDLLVSENILELFNNHYICTSKLIINQINDKLL